MRTKFLLVSLLSFVLVQAQVMARYTYNPGVSSQSLFGVYAGVLIPIEDNLLVPTATDFGTNSLGLFTLGIPDSGIGSGAAVIFSSGNTFDGTIQAIPNPDSSGGGGIVGILNATFDYNLIVTDTAGGTVTSTSEALTASAQGSFDASVVSNSASVGGFGLDLSGTSQLNVNDGFVSGANGTPVIAEQVTFQIEGYEQSNVAPASTSGT